mgnify:CR=1 FL=1
MQAKSGKRRAKAREKSRRERAKRKKAKEKKKRKLAKKVRAWVISGIYFDDCLVSGSIDVQLGKDTPPESSESETDEELKSTESESLSESSNSDALEGVYRRHRTDGVDPGILRRRGVRSARVYGRVLNLFCDKDSLNLEQIGDDWSCFCRSYYYCHLFRNLAHSLEELWLRALQQSADSLTFLLCKTTWCEHSLRLAVLLHCAWLRHENINPRFASRYKMFMVAAALDRQSM